MHPLPSPSRRPHPPGRVGDQACSQRPCINKNKKPTCSTPAPGHHAQILDRLIHTFRFIGCTLWFALGPGIISVSCCTRFMFSSGARRDIACLRSENHRHTVRIHFCSSLAQASCAGPGSLGLVFGPFALEFGPETAEVLDGTFRIRGVVVLPAFGKASRCRADAAFVVDSLSRDGYGCVSIAGFRPPPV